MREERRYSDQHIGMQAHARGRNSRMRRVRQLRRRIMLTAVTVCLSAVIGILGCSFLTEAQSGEAEVSYKYFTSIQIRPGDTLYSIASEYADEHYASVYAYMEEVCLTNHMLSEEISAGDYLVIPYYSTEFR